MTGLNESTVRVHLFRAARKLRGLLRRQAVRARAHHLQDERLFECYLAARERRDALDPPAAEHLADCDGCAARYAELTAFMDDRARRSGRRGRRGVHRRAAAAQQQQIARRLEHVGRAARVISFPGQRAARRIGRARDPASRRAGSRRPPRRACSSASALGASARRGHPHVRVAHGQRGGRRGPHRPRRRGSRRRRPRHGAADGRRRRRVPLGAGSGARTSAHARAARPSTRSRRTCASTIRRRIAAARLTVARGRPALASPCMPSDLPQRPRPEACRRRHAGRELSQRARRSRSRRTTSPTAPAGSRCISRANSASATASIAPSTTRTRRASGFPIAPCLPDRRNHPQPARERKAARDGHPVPERPSRTRIDALRPRRRRDPAGVRRHRGDAAAARAPRLHAHRHDLRLGAERLEERPPLRRRRLHVDHPRQGVARRDAGDRVAGGRSTAAATGRLRPRAKPEMVCDYIRARRRSRRRSWRGSATRRRPASIPIATCSASASPTRRRC